RENYLKTFNGIETSFELFINNQHQLYKTVPFFDEKNQITRILSVVENITERKLAEEALQVSKEQFQGIFNNLQDGFFQANLSGNFILVSPSAASMYGYDSAEEMIGMPAINLYADGAEREKLIKELSDKKSIRDFIGHGKRKDGSTFWVSMNIQLIYQNGEVCGTEGVVSDITERKHAEVQLSLLSQRQEAILKAVPDILMEVDNNKVYTWANQAGTDFFGDEVIGKNAAFYFEGEQETYDLVMPLFNGSKDNICLESWQRRKDGEKRLLFWTCRTLKDAQGKVTGVLSTALDITDRRQLEEVHTFLSTSGYPGSDKNFFESLAKYLAGILDSEYVCIDKLEGDGLTAQTVAIYNEGKFEPNVSYTLKQTPCGDVVGKTICCFPENVCQLFPHDEALQDLKAESYIGTTLCSFDGQPIGLIAVIGQKPLKNAAFAEKVLKLVAIRAAGELERMQSEKVLKESESRFKNMFEGHSSIMLLIEPESGKIIGANESSSRFYGYSKSQLLSMRIDEINMLSTEQVKIEREHALHQEQSYFVFPHRLANGDVRTVEVHSTPIVFQDHQILFSIIHDITERKL
ncbi:MAG: PAS domain S-box protein, partial [Bacteroidales bacterium]